MRATTRTLLRVCRAIAATWPVSRSTSAIATPARRRSVRASCFIRRPAARPRSRNRVLLARPTGAHPERVARLVLLGSPGSLGDNQEELELQAAVRALEDPVPARFARELQGAAAHVPLPEAFFERLVADSLKLPARVWKGTLEGLFAFDDAAELRRIAAPTLLVWGEWDRWLPREEEGHLAMAISGAKVIVYPATGHSPNWERPERVAADLDAFMREA